ncbi:MAG: dTMP kinase [Oscillospiraceae bacterium]|nr:deoxynucleoside kinase [Bacillota bacterium]
MGKLIVLEGTDGSGKSTQFGLLTQGLEAEGMAFRKLVFPQYAEPSSALIRMYLNGEFGQHPGDVNAYAATAFYAVDRYASFQKVWRREYEAGGLILSDRYTTSNAVHQGSKLTGAEQRAYFQWLEEFEYGRLGLPRPDLVIYLDVPTDLTEMMLRKREQDTHTQGDIHEQDLAYLRLCRETGQAAADFFGWQVISCARDGAMRPAQEIHQEIDRLVRICLEE